MCIVPINTIQNWIAEFNYWLPQKVSRKLLDPGSDSLGPDPNFEKKPDPDTTLHKMTGSKSNNKENLDPTKKYSFRAF